MLISAVTSNQYLMISIVFILIIILFLLLNYFLDRHFRVRFGSDINEVKKARRYTKLSLLILFIGITYIGLFEYLKLNQIETYFSQYKLISNSLLSVSLYSIVRSLFRLFFFYFLFSSLKYLVYLHYIKINNEDAALSLKSLISNVGILLIVAIFLSDLGINWKLLVPVAGALGIGVGIGLQNIMNNYLSGFILLFTKKLKIGDIVELEGNAGRAIGNQLQTIYGRIRNIDALNTVLLTSDGIEIIVPNSNFISGQIVNYSLSDSIIRLRIPFGVAYKSDPKTVKEILLKVANETNNILMLPSPEVWFIEFGESSLVFNLLCWVNIKNMWKVNGLISDIYFRGWYGLKEGGIEIPFPQQDVWFKNNLKVEIDKQV